MAVDISKLVDNGVQEAHAGIRGKLLDDLLEYLIAFLLQGFLLRVALMGTVLDVESNCVENA